MPAPRAPVELRDFDEPALEPGSVLLRTLYSEVCGTDVHIWHGRLAGVPYPITDAGPSSINVHQQINRKHLEIRGCWGSELGHFVRALRVLERHHAAVPWRAIGARTYTLSELNGALADAEAMRLPKALVEPRH